ncbi:MAG: carboxyl transferase domain-containing protein [Maricaulaceae bacterium]
MTTHKIKAPLHGTIVLFNAAVGDSVAKGSVIAVMEAMKMQYDVKAPVSGTVKAIKASVGDLPLKDAVIMTLTESREAITETAAEAPVDKTAIRPDLQAALDRRAAGHDESRPEAVAKRHKRGQRTIRENIADLCDEDSFAEYGAMGIAAQRRRRSVDDLITNTSGDGLIAGIGHVNGELFEESKTRIAIAAHDYSVLAGTQGTIGHMKMDRIFDVAKRQKLPLVLFAEGGGGRPGDTDHLPIPGLTIGTFTELAGLSGLVPLVGITAGRCFAGNAVLLGCCDVIIAAENSNIGIGGPAMVEGGGQGVYRPEEIGSMDVQVPNGVVDIAVKNEAEAVATAKTYLSYFQGATTEWNAPDELAARIAVLEDRLKYFDMRGVLETIADAGSVLEIRRGFAAGMITSFIRVEGRAMGVIANDPGHLAGAVDTDGADKAARFMQLCDAFDIPLLSLIDCPGIMVGPEAEKDATVRHAARIFNVGASLDIPFFAVVIRKAYGLGAMAMAGGSMHKPMFTVSWPTGEFGAMGLEGAVKLGYAKELAAITDKAERKAKYDAMVTKAYEDGSALNMASYFQVDDVIDPADTRKWIMAGLKSCPPPAPRTGKKRPMVDSW